MIPILLSIKKTRLALVGFSSEMAYATSSRLQSDQPDIIFCNMITYATSSVFAPIIREASCPVVLLALQPLSHLDYTRANTFMQLENDNICSVPEFTGVAIRFDAQDISLIQKRDRAFYQLVKSMTGHQLAFELGDEETLSQMGSLAQNNRLAVGAMAYAVVVLPPLLTIRGETLRLLHDFVEQGGRVLVLERLPEKMDGCRAESELPPEISLREDVLYGQNGIGRRAQWFISTGVPPHFQQQRVGIVPLNAPVAFQIYLAGNHRLVVRHPYPGRQAEHGTLRPIRLIIANMGWIRAFSPSPQGIKDAVHAAVIDAQRGKHIEHVLLIPQPEVLGADPVHLAEHPFLSRLMGSRRALKRGNEFAVYKMQLLRTTWPYLLPPVCTVFR